ncbi:restriction endonuclease subunit M [Desulfosarcina widdelii]|uniref:site-specific DNA-methyltransferase (adenine-specific) n=1 Tax=Desulfosarcina widdelii TaxID=947919 RepID=A0A5K7ZPP4_9BACT|nr:DNA adenine methylase [Desulfosarcina widdelii]BBO78587.1 restriction endonuclease subunit M [Desulfosarcina widdelii]
MNSPLAYIGGKSKLSSTIIDMIPPHKAYCEVFAGAAWVFFRKPTSKFEVINDLDSDLVVFYRVLQNHLEEFLRQFKWLLSSREQFEDFMRQQTAGGLTDIQRAARYYYLQRLCFGGRVKGRVYGTAPMHAPRINLLRLEEELSAVHLRLVGVTIEHLPWEDFIRRYDKPGTLFYCDPPYYKKPFYAHNLDLADFQRMAEVLAGIKSKFILSINDHPDIREVFGEFKVRPISLKYTVSKGKQIKGRELVVTNY